MNTLLNPRNCLIYDIHERWLIRLITKILLQLLLRSILFFSFRKRFDTEKTLLLLSEYIRKRYSSLFVVNMAHQNFLSVSFFTFSTCKCLYFSTPFCAVSSYLFFYSSLNSSFYANFFSKIDSCLCYLFLVTYIIMLAVIFFIIVTAHRSSY